MDELENVEKLLKGSSELEVVSIRKLNHFIPSVVSNHETGCGVTWLLSRLAVDRQRIVIAQLLVMATRTTANRKMRSFHSPDIEVLLRSSETGTSEDILCKLSRHQNNPLMSSGERSWRRRELGQVNSEYYQPVREQKQQAEDVQAEQEPGYDQGLCDR